MKNENYDNHSCACDTEKDNGCTSVMEKTSPSITVEPKWHSHKTDAGYNLEIALPGVSKDQLQVTAVAEGLQIEATRHITAPDDWRLIAGGRLADSYRLKLRLPKDVNVSALEAKLENGLLNIKLPLKDEAKSRRIEIN